MQRYMMSLRKKDTLGEGSFGVCYRGIDIKTGQPVAIKVYKTRRESRGWARPSAALLQKFKRQISVLQELQEPFPAEVDTALWSDELSRVQPSDIFMRLLDYSRDASGEPGPDPQDGGLYIVTELAQYSLKDLLEAHRRLGRPLPHEAVRGVVADVLLAVAGLHAKGFVHLDIKPSNLMIFDGHLKLIDTDGCVRAGTSISTSDPSISFSPCYCAPEFARFLTQSSDRPVDIKVAPSLDAWSTGMALCEVVHLSMILSPKLESFEETAPSRKAGYLFLEWLGRMESAESVEEMQRSVTDVDPELRDLLLGRLLACKDSERPTLARCLAHEYLAQPRAWTFPTQQQLAQCSTTGPPKSDERLVEATDRLVDREAGQVVPKKLSVISRLSSKSTMSIGSSKAMKLARRPSLALDRSVQFLKSVVGTMTVAADMSGMPQMRNAFDEA